MSAITNVFGNERKLAEMKAEITALKARVEMFDLWMQAWVDGDNRDMRAVILQWRELRKETVG